MKTHWQLQEAKNRLSEVVERACTSGPQVITVRGRVKAVLLSADEYKRLTQPATSLVEFFRQSPLYGIELDVDRRPDVGRDIDL